MRLLPLPKWVSSILSPGFAYFCKIHVYNATGFCVGWMRFSFSDLFPLLDCPLCNTLPLEHPIPHIAE